MHANEWVFSWMLYTLSDCSWTLWQALLEAMAHLWDPGDNKVKKASLLFLCLSIRTHLLICKWVFCLWTVSVCCLTQWRRWTAERGLRWGDEPSSCSTTCSAHLSMTDTLSKCLSKVFIQLTAECKCMKFYIYTFPLWSKVESNLNIEQSIGG